MSGGLVPEATVELTGGELIGEAVVGDLRGLLEASEDVLGSNPGSGESVTLISGLSESLVGSRSGGGEVGVTSTTLSILIIFLLNFQNLMGTK